MDYIRINSRISCGPAEQDWCNLTVGQQGFAPIHMKKWSDNYEKKPQIRYA